MNQRVASFLRGVTESGTEAPGVSAGLKAARSVGSAVGWFFGNIVRWRRSDVETAMRRAGVVDPEATAREMYRQLGRGLFELVWLVLHPRRPLDDLVSLDEATLDGCTDSGRGAVVAMLHAGNWDMLACAYAAHRPLTVVTKRFPIETLDRMWQEVRARRGVRLVSVGGVWDAARSTFANGGAFAMMMDQTPLRERGVVLGRFLGAPAYIDLAPALVAMRNRRPLVLVLTKRLPDETITAFIDHVVEPPEKPTRRWAEQTMLSLSQRIEQHVLERPEQWLWLHHRWADTIGPRTGWFEPAKPQRVRRSFANPSAVRETPV